MFVSYAARTNSVKILADDTETMTETLERALELLLIIGSFCNLGMFEYPRRQSRAYLSCLYALAKWSSLIYFFYYPYIINIIQDDDEVLIQQIIELIFINTLIPISFCRFKVRILKYTLDSYIIILNLILLLLFNNIFN